MKFTNKRFSLFSNVVIIAFIGALAMFNTSCAPDDIKACPTGTWDLCGVDMVKGCTTGNNSFESCSPVIPKDRECSEFENC